MKKKQNKNVNVTLTEHQLFIIERCLEIVSRISAGQLSNIEEAVSLGRGKAVEVKITPEILNGISSELHDIYFDSRQCDKFAWLRLGNVIERLIKPILFPTLHRSASYGVGTKEIPNATIMYEMYKKIQNFRTKDLPEGEGGVMRHEPLHYSKEPLIEINKI